MLVSKGLEETEKTYELYSSFIFSNKDGKIIKKFTKTIEDFMEKFQKHFNGEHVSFLFWIHSGEEGDGEKSTDARWFSTRFRLPGEPDKDVEEGEDEEADKADSIANEQWDYVLQKFKTTDVEKGLNELPDLGF
ncbi:hypothetical protein ONZ45_g2824 [Pleurotus djamor]|nr:hypothetical protein ONZ45_g2824 [Pleurotus djamor]